MQILPKNHKSASRRWIRIKPVDEIIFAFQQKEMINTFTLILILTGRKDPRASSSSAAKRIIEELEQSLKERNYRLLKKCKKNGRKYYYIKRFTPDNVWPCQIQKTKLQYCSNKFDCQSGFRGACKIRGKV